MRNRRIWELAFCLIGVAMLMGWFWAPTLPATAPLSVCGIRPGMTRGQVIRILGKPQVQGASYAYYDEYLKSFHPSDKFRKPEIFFGESGRVIGVAGPSLEWPGGSLAKGTSLKSALTLFPACSPVRPPRVDGRFGDFGIYDCPQNQLEIFSILTDGWFAREEFLGARLCSGGPAVVAR